MALLHRLRHNVLPLFSEETRVARYLVLAASVGGITAPGGPLEVHGSEWAPKFALPGIMSNVPAVLTFEAKPKDAGTRFTVRVSTSGRGHLVDHTFSDTQKQLFHVVVPPAVLQEASNELIFSVAAGAPAGVVTFSDAVILYTSNTLTIKKPPEIIQ